MQPGRLPGAPQGRGTGPPKGLAIWPTAPVAALPCRGGAVTPCCPDLPPTRAATSRANDFAELCVSARAAGPVTASVRRSQWCSRGCTAPTAVHGRRAPHPGEHPGASRRLLPSSADPQCTVQPPAPWLFYPKEWKARVCTMTCMRLWSTCARGGRSWKQPGCPSAGAWNGHIEPWSLWAMEYYSALNRNMLRVREMARSWLTSSQ